MRADDLLLLLEVARSGTFAQAAKALGVEHTTVSRRMNALEADLGDRVVDRSARGAELTELGRLLLPAAERVERAVQQARHAAQPDRTVSGRVRIAATEGMGIRFVAPVMARLHRRHPDLTLELVTVTRPLGQTPGIDVEIGVGHPDTRRFEVVPLAPYVLALYASAEYLQAFGTPATPADLAGHSLVYYIDSLQRVPDLDLQTLALPTGAARVASTNVFAHVEATRAGAGIGLLPAFLAITAPDLVRVLPQAVRLERQYVALVAPEALRRPAAAAVTTELRREVAARRAELMGERPRAVPPAPRG